MSSYFLFI